MRKKFKLNKEKITSLILAGAMSITMSACSSNNNTSLENENAINIEELENIETLDDSVETTVEAEEYVMPESLETKNCSLVFLDGNVYLTVKKDVSNNCTEKWYHGLHDYLSIYVDVYEEIEYWNVLNNEFVGKTVNVNLLKLATHDYRDINLNCGWLVYKRKGEMDVSTISKNDSNYYNGTYGFGYILPNEAIIPLNNLISTEYIKKNDIEFLTGNTNELKEFLANKVVWSNNVIPQNILWSIKDDNFKIESLEDKYSYLTKFICKKSDESTDIFIGYRCAINSSDRGYDYVYDVLDGTINYIGALSKESYIDVTLEPIINNKKTLKELKSELLNEPLVEESLTEEVIEDNADKIITYSIDDIYTYPERVDGEEKTRLAICNSTALGFKNCNVIDNVNASLIVFSNSAILYESNEFKLSTYEVKTLGELLKSLDIDYKDNYSIEEINMINLYLNANITLEKLKDSLNKEIDYEYTTYLPFDTSSKSDYNYLILDTTKEDIEMDGDFPKYCIFKFKSSDDLGLLYNDIVDVNGLIAVNPWLTCGFYDNYQGKNLTYIKNWDSNEPSNKYYAPNETLMTLKNFLEVNYPDLAKETYTDEELVDIANMLNSDYTRTKN